MQELKFEQVKEVSGGLPVVAPVVIIAAGAAAANNRMNNNTQNAIGACGEGNVKSVNLWGYKCKK